MLFDLLLGCVSNAAIIANAAALSPGTIRRLSEEGDQSGE